MDIENDALLRRADEIAELRAEPCDGDLVAESPAACERRAHPPSP